MRARFLLLLLATAPALVLPPDATARICLCRGFADSMVGNLGGAPDKACCLPARSGEDGSFGHGGVDCFVFVTTPHREPSPPAPAAETAPAPPPGPVLGCALLSFAWIAVEPRRIECGPPPDPGASRNLPRVV
jgi:hypothetical protein